MRYLERLDIPKNRRAVRRSFRIIYKYVSTFRTILLICSLKSARGTCLFRYDTIIVRHEDRDDACGGTDDNGPSLVFKITSQKNSTKLCIEHLRVAAFCEYLCGVVGLGRRGRRSTRFLGLRLIRPFWTMFFHEAITRTTIRIERTSDNS